MSESIYFAVYFTVHKNWVRKNSAKSIGIFESVSIDSDFVGILGICTLRRRSPGGPGCNPDGCKYFDT